MLDLKVFTPKYVSQEEILKHMMKMRESKLANGQVDKKPIKSYIEYCKTYFNRNKRFKDVDEVFEFKSVSEKDDYKNDPYDKDVEEKVFKKIKKHLKKVNIKYNKNDLSNAFYFIQKIRRNQQLEEEITGFRKKIKDFKETIEKNYPEQKYYHLYPSDYPLVYPWMPSLYKFNYADPFFYSQYIKSNLEMPPEIHLLFEEILLKYKINVILKPLLVDLFFHGVIPLDAVVQKTPMELTIHKYYISLNIYDRVPISNIKTFINKHKKYINKFNKERKKENEGHEEKKDTEESKKVGLDSFDRTIKYNHNKPYKERVLVKSIGREISQKYKKRIRINTPKRRFKPVKKRIEAIFKIKQ